MMLHTSILYPKEALYLNATALTLLEEIHIEGEEEGRKQSADPTSPSVSMGVPASYLISANGVIWAITFVSSLVKYAFHMTAKKERKKIISEEETLRPEGPAGLGIFSQALNAPTK